MPLIFANRHLGNITGVHVGSCSRSLLVLMLTKFHPANITIIRSVTKSTQQHPRQQSEEVLACRASFQSTILTYFDATSLLNKIPAWQWELGPTFVLSLEIDPECPCCLSQSSMFPRLISLSSMLLSCSAKVLLAHEWNLTCRMDRHTEC